MKYKEYDTYIQDEGEPVLRSCWECNPAHEHLKNVTMLHYCLWCDRYWIHGRYLDSFETTELMDAFLKEKLEPTPLEKTP